MDPGLRRDDEVGAPGIPDALDISYMSYFFNSSPRAW